MKNENGIAASINTNGNSSQSVESIEIPSNDINKIAKGRSEIKDNNDETIQQETKDNVTTEETDKKILMKSDTSNKLEILKENTNNIISRTENDMIEVEDPDDYLIYLEDILKKIHQEFYEEYDKMDSGEIPDLKKVIPKVRSRVLKKCSLVFSGLVPTRTKLEHSKAYQVAKGLGADVSQDLEDTTTHLVAVRPGTVKVNAGKKKRNLKIVTPDWLWCCAER